MGTSLPHTGNIVQPQPNGKEEHWELCLVGFKIKATLEERADVPGPLAQNMICISNTCT